MASKQVSSAFRLGSTAKLWGYVYQLDKRKSSDTCLVLKVFLYYYFLRRSVHVINFFFYYTRVCAMLHLLVAGGVKVYQKENNIWFPRRAELSLKKRVWYTKFKPWTRMFRFHALTSPVVGCYQSFYRRKKKYLRRFIKMRAFIKTQEKKLKFLRTYLKIKHRLKRLSSYALQKTLYKHTELYSPVKHLNPQVLCLQRYRRKWWLLRRRRLLFSKQLFKDTCWTQQAQRDGTEYQLIHNRTKTPSLTALSCVRFSAKTKKYINNQLTRKRPKLRRRSYRLLNFSLCLLKKKTKRKTHQIFLHKFLLRCKKRFRLQQLVHPTKKRKKWLSFKKSCSRQLRSYFLRNLRVKNKQRRLTRKFLSAQRVSLSAAKTSRDKLKSSNLVFRHPGRSRKSLKYKRYSRRSTKSQLKKEILAKLPKWRLRFLPFIHRKWVDRSFRAMQFKTYAGSDQLIRLNISAKQLRVRVGLGLRSVSRATVKRAKYWHSKMWRTKRTVVHQKLKFYGSPWNKKYLKYMLFRKRRYQDRRQLRIHWRQRQQLRAAKKKLLKRRVRMQYFSKIARVFQKTGSSRQLYTPLNLVGNQMTRTLALKRWRAVLKRHKVTPLEDQFNSFRRVRLRNLMKFFEFRSKLKQKSLFLSALSRSRENNHNLLGLVASIFFNETKYSTYLLVQKCVQSCYPTFIKFKKRITILRDYRKLSWFLISKLLVSSRISQIVRFPVWVQVNNPFHLVAKPWQNFYKKVVRWAQYATFLHKRFKKILKRLMLILVFSFRFKSFYRFVKILGFLFNRHRRQQRVIRQFFRVIIKKSLFRFKRLIGWQLILRGKMNRRPRARQLTWWRYRKPALQDNTMSIIYTAREVVTDFGAYYFRLWVYYWF